AASGIYATAGFNPILSNPISIANGFNSLTASGITSPVGGPVADLPSATTNPLRGGIEYTTSSHAPAWISDTELASGQIPARLVSDDNLNITSEIATVCDLQ